MTTLKFADTHNMVAFLYKPTESDGVEQIMDFLNAQPIRYALTVNPTIYISLSLNKSGLLAWSKLSMRKYSYMPYPKTTALNEFSSTMASAIICLATNQKFNFSKFIFEGNQEQDDDFDFWTDSYASDNDEIPTKQVSQDIMEEVSLTSDEAKLRKMADEMLRQRCTSRDEHQYHIDQMDNFLKSDIVWESRKEILVSPHPRKTTPLVHSCQKDPEAPSLMWQLFKGPRFNNVAIIIIKPNFDSEGKYDSPNPHSFSIASRSSLAPLTIERHAGNPKAGDWRIGRGIKSSVKIYYLENNQD
ncbi:hypothetical protein Tco_0902261 [Tanacetum coccineum]